MSEKKRFVLRIDAEAMRALECWAADEFRSVNGQLEYILTKALKDAGRTPKPRKRLPPNDQPDATNAES